MSVSKPVSSLEQFLDKILDRGGLIDDVYYKFGEGSSSSTPGQVRKILSYKKGQSLKVFNMARNSNIAPDRSFIQCLYHVSLAEYFDITKEPSRRSILPMRRSIILTLETVEY